MSPLLILSSTIALINYAIFSLVIMRGGAKPHRTTRFIIVVIALIITTSLFAQHNATTIYLSGADLIGCTIIFLLTLKHGMGGWAKTDIICLLIALFGIYLWVTTSNPVFALYFAIGADFIGMVPTFIKTYHYPKTEYWLAYAICVPAAILNICANKTFNFAILAFPVYAIIINSIMVAMICRKSNNNSAIIN